MLHTFMWGGAFVAGTVALAWTVYFAMRALASKSIQTDTRELARSVILRAGALHALILALVFAQVFVSYQELRSSLVEEATAIAEIDHDIRRYGTDAEADVRSALSKYVRVVTEDEWSRLALEDRLSPEGWALFEVVYIELLDLVPETPRQDALRDHMLEEIHLIADVRVKREYMAIHAISGLFWFAAIAGVVLVGAPYFTFAPNTLNLILLSVYGAFTGIILLIIYAFSDPFSPPGQLSPAAFERLLETEIGKAH